MNFSRIQMAWRLVIITLFACASNLAIAGTITICNSNSCPIITPPPVVSGPTQVGTIVFTPPTLSPNPDPIQVGIPVLTGGPSQPVGLFELRPMQTASGWDYPFATLGLTSIAIPYFSDAQITAVMTPADWTFETGTTDLFRLGFNAGYMRWTYIGQSSSGYVGVLGFTSNWGPGLSTYRLTQSDQSSYDLMGDIPLSPLAMNAGISADVLSVPEPTMNAMMLIGIAFIGAAIGGRSPRNEFDPETRNLRPVYFRSP